MYKVLDKDIIENEILPYLSTAKRGFKTKSCPTEIVGCVLYKLKTGIQWHMLPVKSLFSDIILSYKTVYGHFRKWSKSGEWESSWLHILKNNKSQLDLSTSSVDGSYTGALYGGEEVGFQTCKMSKTAVPNTVINPRNGTTDEIIIVDERLYEQRYTIERTNAWMDS